MSRQERPSLPLSRSVLNLLNDLRSSTTSQTDPNKVERRRASNRRSQQRTREQKEALIDSLKEENQKLKDRLENQCVCVSSTD